MAIFIIFIILLVILWFIFRKSKNFFDETLVQVLGASGVGKTSTCVYKAKKYCNFANRLYSRRKWFYDKFKKGKYPKYFEQPLLYSTQPIYDNIKKGKLYKYYRPLTLDIIYRRKRPNYRSILFEGESSLIANSLDYKDIILSQQLSLHLKLLRQELRGSYRSIFGRSYPNMITETQSKNDNHFSYDRSITNVLYLCKSKTIPFFKIVWCRDLLLVDSVENNFEDDVKEDKSIRWFLVPKRVFKWYDSFAYACLTDNLPKQDYKNNIYVFRNMFEIPTFHDWKEIKLFNEQYHKAIDDFLLKKEMKKDELQKKDL